MVVAHGFGFTDSCDYRIHTYPERKRERGRILSVRVSARKKCSPVVSTVLVNTLKAGFALYPKNP